MGYKGVYIARTCFPDDTFCNFQEVSVSLPCRQSRSVRKERTCLSEQQLPVTESAMEMGLWLEVCRMNFLHHTKDCIVKIKTKTEVKFEEK